MTRHWLAFAAAAALGCASGPALAQDGPPPPAWADPQAPHEQAVAPEGVHGPEGREFHERRAYGRRIPGAVYPGAPFARPLPPGVVPPQPYPDGPGFAYGSPYPPGATPCGCGAGYTVTWVPIRIETRYRYSPPIRHEREVVEEHVVSRPVVETKVVPVKPATKYVKRAPTRITKSKVTKGKITRTTK